jgi:ATP-dependent Zn protease
VSKTRQTTLDRRANVAARPRIGTADVGRQRERARGRRLLVLALVLAPVLGYLWWPMFGTRPDVFSGPLALLSSIDPIYLMVFVFFFVLIASMLATTLVSGRSPHVMYRPEQIDVRMSDVKGVEPIKEDVNRSIDLFLAGRTFRSTMGGTPRRGLLFEGSPGTGKTLMAKAMAAEAGVPFLFVSGTSFQSMYYGATARKIRSYFKVLRKTARREGAAIGFIEEIDAIATVRGGMSMSPTPATAASVMCCGGLSGLPGAPVVSAAAGAPGTQVSAMVSEGTGGVVNELLVQMQSFDEPTGWQKAVGALIGSVNLMLPAQRQIPRPRPTPVDVLIIAATNRADSLDPALLRPGRFEHYLARKSHEADLDDPERVDALAGVTQGYSPVMIENLLDEALVNAVRRHADAMSWHDIERARLVIGVGLGQPVGYTDHEQRLIATHEAGHATVAHLETPQRRLEVLSIIKRASALGLLAHGDADDVYTRSRTELTGLIRVALGGQVAEEIFFGDVSTGPASDLAYATQVGAQMVGSAGMLDTLVSYAAIKGGAFDNGDLVGRVLGNRDAAAALESLLQEQRTYVRSLLRRNRHLVEALRDALLERHELIGHEITDVLASAQAAATQIVELEPADVHLADDPLSGDPVSGDPVSGDLVSGALVNGDPVNGDPVNGDPVSSAPLVIDLRDPAPRLID